MRKKESFIFLDIDKNYFIKPESHYIFYRKSASGRHFHLKFKRSWLTTHEIAELVKQSDPNWLAYCIAEGKFRIAGSKQGKKASEWKQTEIPIPILILRGCGNINTKVKHGFAIRSNGYLETDWKEKAFKEMEKLYKLMPQSFKLTSDAARYSMDDYDDWDEEDWEDDQW